MQHQTKTLRERLLHATLYEVVAIVICTPLFAWLSGTPMLEMGALNFAISCIAMVWNMVFNAFYERMLRRYHLQKTLTLRIAHGLGFEGGITVMVVPLAAWWLNISLWQAFWLDAGILLFFLPYTVVFNWCYDMARARLLR